MREALRAAYHHVWRLYSRPEPREINPCAYVKYIESLNFKGCDLSRIFNTITSGEYTHCHHCHGDMTLQNAIYANGPVKFIDAGDPRGLPCVQMDVAKLLQSAWGWDELFGEVVIEPNAIHNYMSREVLALLATHCVRLLRHWHQVTRVSNWAHDTIALVNRML